MVTFGGHLGWSLLVVTFGGHLGWSLMVVTFGHFW